jgi:hypothetical protein
MNLRNIGYSLINRAWPMAEFYAGEYVNRALQRSIENTVWQSVRKTWLLIELTTRDGYGFE